jgi:hypothetical protein
MFAVLTAGLYGVVSPSVNSEDLRADFCKIYGPAEVPKESESANVGSETSPLLEDNGEEGLSYTADTGPGV